MRGWASTVTTLVAVGAVAALLITLTFAQSASKSVAAHLSPTPSPSSEASPRPQPLPQATNSTGVEIDFVDHSTGFDLLCTVPGGNGDCQYWISRTTDGADHWSAPVKVGPRVTGGDSGHHIHFANAEDGLMYGNSSAYVTHDGGRTWTALNLKSLEIVSITGSSPMLMVMYPCEKGIICPFQVRSSGDGGRTWSLVSSLPAGFSPASVAGFGDRGLLISTFGTAGMLITRDGGATWAPIEGQCDADALGNRISTADGAEIWQMCTPLPPDASKSTRPWTNHVSYTQDDGAHWTASELPAGVNETIAAFGYGRVIEATNTAGLMVTSDSLHWTQVTTDPQYLGMLSLTWLPDGHAWALGMTGTIWATTDYGATWAALPAQP